MNAQIRLAAPSSNNDEHIHTGSALFAGPPGLPAAGDYSGKQLVGG